jgi:uncharacterized Zn-binding protein involved in type VI secretion
MKGPAARVGDLAAPDHPGIIAPPGAPTVKIGGSFAARMGDTFTCTLPPNAGPHPANAIVLSSTSVKIGGSFAARIGDACACGARIAAVGALNVLIGD